MMSSRTLFLALMSVLSLCGSCQNRESQIALEGRAGRELASLLSAHELLGHARPTNLAEVFAPLKSPYPYYWDQQFEAFGKRAGFSNSFFEKYVFLPNGVTNRWVVGEILMMNAQPYEDINRKKLRGIVSKVGTRYGWSELSETLVQDLFREAGIPEPKVITMPAPPPLPREQDLRNPFYVEISNALLGLGRDLGLSPQGTIMFRHAIFYSPVVLLPLLGFWLWRRSRR